MSSWVVSPARPTRRSSSGAVAGWSNSGGHRHPPVGVLLPHGRRRRLRRRDLPIGAPTAASKAPSVGSYLAAVGDFSPAADNRERLPTLHRAGTYHRGRAPLRKCSTSSPYDSPATAAVATNQPGMRPLDHRSRHPGWGGLVLSRPPCPPAAGTVRRLPSTRRAHNRPPWT
jgi:hypothetical protein